MPVNSHIQIPNAVLKQFREKSGRIFYLDIKKQHIGLTASNKIGTEFGYYSDEIEGYLSREIEDPFARVLGKIIRFVRENNETLTLPVESEDVVKKYVTAAMARSGFTLSTFMKGSVTALHYSDRDNHDALVYTATKVNDGIIPDIIDYNMAVVVNLTDTSFVVPRNCFYTLQIEEIYYIIVPISPDCVICLMPKTSQNYVEVLNISRDYRAGYIKSTDVVEVMNISALRYEYVFNQSFVVSRNKEELEYLLSFMKENISQLEQSRTDCYADD